MDKNSKIRQKDENMAYQYKLTPNIRQPAKRGYTHKHQARTSLESAKQKTSKGNQSTESQDIPPSTMTPPPDKEEQPYT